ncbi:MAG: alpha/beta hydrolase [Sandaracinaceae bacterium]|nr:alpha/beta hydrolase [Sandaracinaceae bacterium]
MGADLRGYGASDRPRGTRAYAIETLMDDVEGLIEAAGAERATIVAHDWGGIIAWWLAMRRPARVERLACLNIAHPMPIRREMFRLRQLSRLWYVVAFQIPGLAERSLSEDGHRRLDNAFLLHLRAAGSLHRGGPPRLPRGGRAAGRAHRDALLLPRVRARRRPAAAARARLPP